MTECLKENWKGRCCCNCANQTVIMKHPWNEGDGKGMISEIMGYGCKCPDFQDKDGLPKLIFFDWNHGLCEMHEFRNANT